MDFKPPSGSEPELAADATLGVRGATGGGANAEVVGDLVDDGVLPLNSRAEGIGTWDAMVTSSGKPVSDEGDACTYAPVGAEVTPRRIKLGLISLTLEGVRDRLGADCGDPFDGSRGSVT